MVTRTGKAYTRMEARNYGGYNNNNRQVSYNQFNYANSYANADVEIGVSIASQLLNQIFSGFACNAAAPGTTAGGGSPKKEVKAVEQPKEEAPKPEIKAEDVVKDLVKDYDKMSSDLQKDLVKKYNAIKQVKPNTSDEEITRRLTNYAKALKAHTIELEMGKELEKAEESDYQITTAEILESSNLKIIDEDIASASDPSQDEFFNTRLNRGAGYVELYDSNGDEVIDFKEFKALEEKDRGQKLTSEKIETTKELFDRIDKNNDQSIDATEMASHLYAVSRITDEGTNGTTADITIKEWALSQREVGVDDRYTERYNGRYDEFYDAIKQREN